MFFFNEQAVIAKNSLQNAQAQSFQRSFPNIRRRTQKYSARKVSMRSSKKDKHKAGYEQCRKFQARKSKSTKSEGLQILQKLRLDCASQAQHNQARKLPAIFYLQIFRHLLPPQVFSVLNEDEAPSENPSPKIPRNKKKYAADGSRKSY